jgi:hypothetical protein
LGVVVGYYIITYGKEKTGLILTFLFMLSVSLLLEAFEASQILIFARNISFGVLSVTVGMLCSKYSERTKKIKLSFMFLLSALLVGIEIGLYVILKLGIPQISIPVLLLAFSVFLLLLKINGEGIGKYHGEILVFSGITYFIHDPIHYWLQSYIENPFIIFFIVMLSTSIISAIVITFSRGKKKNEIRKITA